MSDDIRSIFDRISGPAMEELKELGQLWNYDKPPETFSAPAAIGAEVVAHGEGHIRRLDVRVRQSGNSPCSDLRWADDMVGDPRGFNAIGTVFNEHAHRMANCWNSHDELLTALRVAARDLQLIADCTPGDYAKKAAASAAAALARAERVL